LSSFLCASSARGLGHGHGRTHQIHLLIATYASKRAPTWRHCTCDVFSPFFSFNILYASSNYYYCSSKATTTMVQLKV
jgi:hypothetical protein